MMCCSLEDPGMQICDLGLVAFHFDYRIGNSDGEVIETAISDICEVFFPGLLSAAHMGKDHIL